jgi:hypothetical protein
MKIDRRILLTIFGLIVMQWTVPSWAKDAYLSDIVLSRGVLQRK